MVIPEGPHRSIRRPPLPSGPIHNYAEGHESDSATERRQATEH